MKNLLIATYNTGKLIEIQKILSDIPIQICSLSDLNIQRYPEEIHDTFEENAILKSEFFYNISQIPTVADDSGIIIDALKGELGVKTRRWGAGAKASDQEWIDFFLNRMKNEKNKKAKFITVAALTIKNKTVTFRGEIEGNITEEVEYPFLPKLPLSGCFKPNGQTKVLSQIWEENREFPMHRTIAFQKVKNHLSTIL